MEESALAAGGAFYTPWALEVDADMPLPEYPRPSLVRKDWLCLNGRWDYAIRLIDRQPEAYYGEIIVPFPVESALSGARRKLRPEEALWYRREFRVPPAWRGRRVLLHFGAVDWGARVLVNGVQVGVHRGGYVPFCFDVTESLKEGDAAQEIVVEVRDPTDSGGQCRGKQARRPRGIWYTSASGIWGTVWLEPVHAARIVKVVAQAAPGLSTGTARLVVRARLDIPRDARSSLRLRVAASAEGRTVAEREVRFGVEDAVVELEIPAPRLWSPESPFLYGLRLELEGGDAAESYAALRAVELRPDAAGRARVFLNGEPYYNNAVLDQGYWPDGIYTAPTDEALASDIARAKELGFNAIRKHAKVESERWYWHCDRLGMIVWQDIPSGGAPMRFLYSAILGFLGVRLRDDRLLGRFGRATEEGRDDFEIEATAILDYLEGFPCIAAWVPFNEGWGQFDSARIAAWVAERDPTRLVDAASGWYDRGAGRFASRHDYSTSPRAPRADRGRAAALTEYGGLTLRVAGHSTEDRRQFGYAGARDAEDLTSGYEALAARLAVLAREGLAASVYTQISDVEIERNGLVTYDRMVVKADPARVRAANLALTAAAAEAAGIGRASG
jgi:beta-galactosidase/beta-glucuronidase